MPRLIRIITQILNLVDITFSAIAENVRIGQKFKTIIISNLKCQNYKYQITKIKRNGFPG